MSVSCQNVSDWAVKANNARGLSNLVRKLVVETTPLLRSVEFPFREAANFPNFDGYSDNQDATAWVNKGKSYWTLSCANRVRNVSNDYIAQIKTIQSLEKKDRNFVFVAPGGTYESELSSIESIKIDKADSPHIRVMDAEVITTWLLETVVTKQWFEEQIGVNDTGIQTLESWWNSWTADLLHNFSTSFVSSRQYNESQDLIDRIRSNKSEIAVYGETRKEAVAFAVATFLESPYKGLVDKTIIVKKANAKIPDKSDANLVIICDLPDDQIPDFGNCENQVIIRTSLKNSHIVKLPIELSSVPKTRFLEELQSWSIPKSKASQIATECGYSIPILWTRFSKDHKKSSLPIWARDTKLVKNVIPFALCGQWVNDDSFADKSIVEFIGNFKKDEVDQVIKKCKTAHDAPITSQSDEISVNSKLNLMFEVGDKIEKSHLDRFFKIASEVLERISVKNRIADVSGEKRIFNLNNKYSDQLISGICETLCILAIHGSVICRGIQVDLSEQVNELISNTLKDAEVEHWVQLGHNLSYLAEASPDLFLQSFINNRDLHVRILKYFFESNEISTNSRSNSPKDAILAFERLAWHPEFFGKIATILLFVQSIGFNSDRVTNFAKEKLEQLFRVRKPSTVISFKERLSILRKNAKDKELRTPVMDVCISLLPSPTKWLEPSARPRWRILNQAVPVPQVRDKEHSEKEARKLLFSMAPYSKQELKKLLEILPKLELSGTKFLLPEVEKFVKEADDYEKAELRNSLFGSTLDLRSYKKYYRAPIWDLVAKLDKLLTPTLPSARHLWLFDREIINWKLVTEYSVKNKPSNTDERIEQRRKVAIQEILDQQGDGSLMEFISNVSRADIVARSLFQLKDSLQEKDEWIKRVLSTPESKSTNLFLFGAMRSLSESDLIKGVKLLKKKKVLNSTGKCERLVKSLPPIPVSWKIASEMGTKFDKLYWQYIDILFKCDLKTKDLRIAVKKLVAADRALDAFQLAFPTREKLGTEYWIEILKGMSRFEDVDRDLPDSYNFTKIFQLLDQDKNVLVNQIAELEQPFILKLLEFGSNSTQRVTAWYRLFCQEPIRLIEFLSWKYKSGVEDDKSKSEKLSAEELNFKSEIIDCLLDNWDVNPGFDSKGEFDPIKFFDWVRLAHEIAVEHKLVDKMDYHIGITFAKSIEDDKIKSKIPEDILKVFKNVSKKENMNRFSELLLGLVKKQEQKKPVREVRKDEWDLDSRLVEATISKGKARFAA